jgi:hypothetical protein
MTIVGISFHTLISIFFWGWVSGIVTVFAVGALLSKVWCSKKKD